MKYQVIYADPPWSYRDKALNRGGAAGKYSCMTIEDLLALPVPEIAAPDCALFLWATLPQLDQAFPLIKAWGFEYKTAAFTWVKRNKVADSWFWGMGRWTRANAEVCLLATKGKPKRVSAGVHSLIDSRLEGHSKKPDEVRDRIVKLMGDVHRIELFARQATPGWHVWGNEVQSDIEMNAAVREEGLSLGQDASEVESDIREGWDNSVRTAVTELLGYELPGFCSQVQAAIHNHAGGA